MTRKTQDKPEGPLIRMGPSSAHPVGILSLCASNLADPHISTAFPGAALTLPTPLASLTGLITLRPVRSPAFPRVTNSSVCLELGAL